MLGVLEMCFLAVKRILFIRFVGSASKLKEGKRIKHEKFKWFNEWRLCSSSIGSKWHKG